jgi:RNA polymerase sigma-70 factor, ECF subfamily
MSKKDYRVEDNQAIKKCLEGDSDAYREIVDRYQRRAISIAMGYVKNMEDAQDLVQDAFIKAYRSLERFEVGSSFYTWFYRIVVNVCIDHFRKQKKRRAVEYDDSYQRRDVADQHSLTGNTRDLQPHMQNERQEINDALQGALSTLSDKHREVIILREVDDLSYEEIADVLECHIGTVMSRLHHARKKLQEALRPYLLEIGEDVLAEKAGHGVGSKRTDP